MAQMMQNSRLADDSVSIHVVEPYDFALSLQTMRSFQRDAPVQAPRWRTAVKLGATPAVLEVVMEDAKNLRAYSRPQGEENQVRSIVEWVLFADLDLKPFYRLIMGKRELMFVTNKLYGLKPSRPASLFEMAVTVITEQQISLAAAYKIRSRVVQRFGEPVDDLWIFPEPKVLAAASIEDLRSCGLSGQKSTYIKGLAQKVASGEIDLESLKAMDTDKARETIMNIKGFGQWSADYMLIRGLARPNCIPVDDIGIREVMGKYLGAGHRLTSQEVAGKLEPFRPYRGLLAFYFLAANRLKIVTT